MVGKLALLRSLWPIPCWSPGPALRHRRQAVRLVRRDHGRLPAETGPEFERPMQRPVPEPDGGGL